jgi:hypothetical protein
MESCASLPPFPLLLVAWSVIACALVLPSDLVCVVGGGWGGRGVRVRFVVLQLLLLLLLVLVVGLLAGGVRGGAVCGVVEDSGGSGFYVRN